MIRGAGRAFAAAVLGAIAGAAWLALFYGRSPALHLELDVTPPSTVVRGIYPAERDDASGRTFAWTSETLTIQLDDLDRQVDWWLDLTVRGARAGGAANPTLQVLVDGVLVRTHQTTVDFEEIRVPIASRAAQSGLTLDLRSSSTFVPGPADRRSLGVMIDRLTVSPAGIVLPPGPALAGVARGSAAVSAAIALLGVTAGTAVGAAVLSSSGLAALVAWGFGPYTDFAHLAARVSSWVGLLAVLAVAAVRVRHGAPLRNTARFAVAFSIVALVLQLLTVLHPNMPIGDALFHAHRFQEVLAGRWFFTSIAPGNYQFPYAPGLYVVAIPFAGLVRRGAADMTLLRTIVCIAHALAGLLLYGMAVRVRGDRLAGALAVALYHLVPLGFGVIAVGNLTNAFAQSLSVAALAIIASPGLRLEHRAAVVLLTATLTAAFLSHTSAFAIVSVAAVAIAGSYWWRGGPALRSPAAAVLLAVFVAAALAVVTYYAHFIDTYRSELARIGSETATAAPDAGGRGIVDRLVAVPRYLGLYFGLPLLALLAIGTGLLWHRGARDRVTLASAGWAAACLAFLALGIVTPVDMRHYLAAIPVVAVVGGVGAGILWAGDRRGRVVTLVLLVLACVTGIHAWWGTLK